MKTARVLCLLLVISGPAFGLDIQNFKNLYSDAKCSGSDILLYGNNGHWISLPCPSGSFCHKSGDGLICRPKRVRTSTVTITLSSVATMPASSVSPTGAPSTSWSGLPPGSSGMSPPSQSTVSVPAESLPETPTTATTSAVMAPTPGLATNELNVPNQPTGQSVKSTESTMMAPSSPSTNSPSTNSPSTTTPSNNSPSTITPANTNSATNTSPSTETSPASNSPSNPPPAIMPATNMTAMPPATNGTSEPNTPPSPPSDNPTNGGPATIPVATINGEGQDIIIEYRQGGPGDLSIDSIPTSTGSTNTDQSLSQGTQTDQPPQSTQSTQTGTTPSQSTQTDQSPQSPQSTQSTQTDPMASMIDLQTTNPNETVITLNDKSPNTFIQQPGKYTKKILGKLQGVFRSPNSNPSTTPGATPANPIINNNATATPAKKPAAPAAKSTTPPAKSNTTNAKTTTGDNKNTTNNSGKKTLTLDLIKETLKAAGYNNGFKEDFVNELITQINKQSWSSNEVAMFLAQIYHESAGLSALEEKACISTPCPQYSNADKANGPVVAKPGKYYHGRGYIQLTWPGNYQEASKQIYQSDRLYDTPEQVSQDKSVAAAVSIWFWNTKVMSNKDVLNKFGLATKAINGPIECKPGTPNPAAQRRWQNYQAIAKILAVSPLAVESGCYN
ncbi:hypothetical protein NEHOM01_2109 [Nematocida homosporus]|uniref:uncharacterized protein n=1 Tax=Nematocida homosporus TaxID=1912981 RepID=UPI0022206AB6|nr:uncharacterized protein NEHOM01_2109 [Nematocida homosporus]KAI5187347.1 hypothetical protein NEHOM01_2109 [Nematocida homosporus]